MKTVMLAFAMAFMSLTTAQTTWADEFEVLHKENIISVTGNGRIEVAPNMATIEMAVITKGKVVKEAQEANAVVMKQLTTALIGKHKITKNDVKTSNYFINAEYDEKTKALLGYVVRHSLSVRTRQVNSVGEIIDLAAASGANSIDFIQFGLFNQKEFENKALSLAVEDANSKAQAIAAAAGRDLKRLVRVTEGNYRIDGRREQVQKDREAGTEIFAEDVIVTAELTAEYEF